MNTIRTILTALLLAPLLAAAQGYPTKPIRMVIPYAAGGATDTVGRAVSQQLSEALGQPVVIDNRPGAGARLGTEIVARAQPDGYTLLLTAGPPHGVFPLFLKPVTFDTIADFTPIAVVATAPQSLVVNASLPVHSLKELIDYGKKNPGKLSYATAGVGSSQHIGGIMINRAVGIDMVHVPYKGGAPALNDVLGGQVGVGIVILSNVLVHARAGKLRILGVLEAHRPKASPETPTIAEAGIPGYAVPETFIGMLGPAKLPAAIVSQVNAAVVKSIGTPEVAARLAATGFEAKGNTPQQFDEQLRQAFELYRKIADEAGIKPE